MTEQFARELGLVGAVAGGAAALPAVGMAAVLAMSASEFGVFTMRCSELILTIGAIHGHTDVTVEEQRVWIMYVLLFGSGAAESFNKLASEVGKRLGKKAVHAVPTTMIRAINRAAGRTIVTKYGTKRGVVALGRAMPFGVGAVIGAGANYGGVRLLGRHADRFFKNLPYSVVVDDIAAGVWSTTGTVERNHRWSTQTKPNAPEE